MTQLPIQLDTRTEDAALPYGADQLSDDAILNRAEAILTARCVRDGDVVSSPADARALIRMRIAALPYEVFGVVYLSTRHRVLGFEELFRGTIDSCSVYPREVAKAALLNNAAAVLFYHCHPSGDPTPSRADELLTQRLRDALALFDIRVVDHIIVGGTEILSFAERGLL